MIAPLDPELARVFATDEKFEERERRTHAAVVLESEEVLVWWAMERNEVRRSVVPSFRHRSLHQFYLFVYFYFYL